MAQFPEDSLSILDYMRQGQAEINARRRQATMSDRIRNRYAPTFPEDPNAMLQFLERTPGNDVSPEITWLAARLRQAASGSAPGVDVNQRNRDAMDSMWKQRIEGADPETIYTPEEAASDNRVALRKILAGRNQKAMEGRLSGYMPELTSDEQARVSRRLMGAARGGVVDETSPLNQRGAAFAVAAGRDRSKELQKQAEQQRMSERFQALQATRDPEAVVESSKVLSDRRNVRTIAEKIEGVEDDPSTPMDESVRYRAEWQSPEGKERLKAAGLANASARRQARTERVAQQRNAVSQALLAASSGKDAPTFDDPVLARIAQKAYTRSAGRGTASDQGTGEYLTDEKAAQILQQARQQQFMTGGNEVAQALDYIKSERDRFAQRDEAKAGRQHDLTKIEAQGKVSERLQRNEQTYTSEQELRTQAFQAAQQAAKLAAEAEQRGLDRDTQMALAKTSNDLQRELNKAQIDSSKVDRILRSLESQRDALATVAAAGPDTVAGIKATRQMPAVEAKIDAVLSGDSEKTGKPVATTVGSEKSKASDRLTGNAPPEIPLQSETELNRVLAAGGSPQEQAVAIMDLVKRGLITEPQALQGTGDDYSLTRDAVKAMIAEKLRAAANGPFQKGNPAGYGFREWADEHFGSGGESDPAKMIPRQRFKETKQEFLERVALVNQYRQTLGLPPVSGMWQ